MPLRSVPNRVIWCLWREPQNRTGLNQGWRRCNRAAYYSYIHIIHNNGLLSLVLERSKLGCSEHAWGRGEAKQKSKIKQNGDRKWNKMTLLWVPLLTLWALSPFPLNFRLFTKHESHNKIFHFKYLQNIYFVFSPIFLPFQPNQVVQIQQLCPLILILRQIYYLRKDRGVSQHRQDKKMQS